MKCGMPTGQHGNPVAAVAVARGGPGRVGGLKEGSAQAPLPRRREESEADQLGGRQVCLGKHGRVSGKDGGKLY